MFLQLSKFKITATGLHMCIEIIGKKVLFYNSDLRTQSTLFFVHIVDLLHGFIFTECLISSIL
jgi:hypothetical protein